ncbi:MAG: DUF3467 domain-containing protein [Candidatus Margulisiibacteriota bacterium]
MAEQQIRISLDEKTAEGKYCNIAMISHTENEFVADFAFVHPPAGKVVSRIIMSPSHAKRFLKALGENISNFEKSFGPIKEAPEPPKFGINLGAN